MSKNAKRREWTKDDVRQLKTLARQKTPVGQIAKSLKRTAGATQQKAFTLGVSLDTRGYAVAVVSVPGSPAPGGSVAGRDSLDLAHGKNEISSLLPT